MSKMWPALRVNQVAMPPKLVVVLENSDAVAGAWPRTLPPVRPREAAADDDDVVFVFRRI